MKRINWILIIAVMLVAANALAIDYPKPTSWVNDYAGVLSTSEKQELDAILKEFETKTSAQIFVAIMDRIPSGLSLEEYVNELFERWSPGQKEKDNGVLLAIFVKDRKLRIEVGYGLEGKLTDAASKLIIVNDITPSFKQGDYYRGIRNGLQSIILTLYKDYPFPSKTTIPSSRSVKAPRLNTTYIVIIIWCIWMALMFMRTNARKNRGWTSSRSGWKSTRRKTGWTISFGGGSSRRRSSSFGGSSFGGFSGGGGGSSGGGGASGSW